MDLKSTKTRCNNYCKALLAETAAQDREASVIVSINQVKLDADKLLFLFKYEGFMAVCRN